MARSRDTGAAGGGTGDWDADNLANWWDGASDLKWPVAGGIADDSVFANTAGSVTNAAGGVIASNLTFATTGYEISGGTLAALTRAGGECSLVRDGREFSQTDLC